MDDGITETIGLPLRFPDPRLEARARAMEFRRLPPDGRWREIAALMEWGMSLTHSSPRRLAIELRWQAQEEEWQRLQQRLISEHVK